MSVIHYGTTASGEEIQQFTLRNASGLEVRCINYGCRITHILLPNCQGAPVDIVLGYDYFAGYEQDPYYQGAFVGRYAGRIEGATFKINGTKYQLPQIEKGNFLHGSFVNRVFMSEMLGDNSVAFSYISPDGEDGFPGETRINVLYTLTDNNELLLDYRAFTTAATYINLTNHAYFNLAGQGEDICEHTLYLNSKQFLESREDLCPTGRLLKTKGTAFDFTQAKPIGQDLESDDPQLKLAGGYDHCFVLEKEDTQSFSLAAIAFHPPSNRTMHVYTTQPALQFYTGNFLGSSSVQPGKGNTPFALHSGFCLETQHYPASPSDPQFPSTLLQPGEKFHEVTLFRFEW